MTIKSPQSEKWEKQTNYQPAGICQTCQLFVAISEYHRSDKRILAEVQTPFKITFPSKYVHQFQHS